MDIQLGRSKTVRRAYGIDEIALVPGGRTVDPEVTDTSWSLGGITREIPIIASAMDGVVDVDMAVRLSELGSLGVLNLEGVQTRYEDPNTVLDRIASVGKDGLLCVWDPQSPTPLRQRHNPGMPSWANDLAWAPSAPAIFTSMDIVAVRLQALREDIVIPPLSDKTPGGTKRWRATGGSRGGNEGVLPSGRVLVLGCAPTASVCALSVSAGGERLAGVSNDGRLEVFREVRSQLTKKAFARTLEGVGMLQITTPADESPGGTALHVALGAAAKAVNTAATGGKAYVPSPQMALRALSWNPNEHHSEWLACGGDAGLLISMKVHR